MEQAATYSMRAADWIMLAGYFVIMTGIGLYFARFQHSIEEYFTGKNRIPWWLAGISMWMSGFSALGFIAYSELAYKYGLVAITMFWSVIPALLLGIVFFAPRWRRTGILSPVEFLETRYSLVIRQLLAWEGVVAKIVDDGMKVGAIGIFIAAGLRFNLSTSILVCGVVMLAYTVLGGLWAVMVTDVVQFIIMTSASLILVPLALREVGGVSGLISGSPPGFFRPLATDYGVVYFIGFMVLIAIAYNAHWHRVQRYYSVENEAEARKAVALDLVLETFTGPIFIVAAMASRQFLPDLINPTDPSLNSKMAFPLLCVRVLPAGTLGLILSAMFAGTMASLAAHFNVTASVLTRDIYQRLVNRNASEKQLVRVGKLTTVIVGGLCILIGLVVASVKTDLFAVMNQWFALVLPATMIPMILGLLGQRYGWRSALAGFIGGLVAGVGFQLTKPYHGEWFPTIGPHTREGVSMLVNSAVTYLCMEIVAALERKSEDEIARTKAFFARLSAPVELPRAEGEAPSPFFIVGATIFCTGLLLVAVALLEVANPLSLLINLGLGLVFAALGGALWLASKRTLVAATDDKAA